jgi:hypothetical protein
MCWALCRGSRPFPIYFPLPFMALCYINVKVQRKYQKKNKRKRKKKKEKKPTHTYAIHKKL